jgi:hypothetical protein
VKSLHCEVNLVIEKRGTLISYYYLSVGRVHVLSLLLAFQHTY